MPFCKPSGLPWRTRFCLLVTAIGVVTLNSRTFAAPASAIRFNPSFATGRNGETLDMQQFNARTQLGPGTYRLDVSVNQQPVGRLALTVSADGTDTAARRYCLNRDELSLLNLDTTKLPDQPGVRRLLAGNACVSLAELVPQSHLEVNTAELRAMISIPQAYLSNKRRGDIDPARWDEGITAGFLDYNANAYQSESQGLGSSQQSIGVNAGLNLSGWRLRHNATLAREAADGQPSEQRYEAISSYAQHDLTALKAQLTAGQYYTPGDLFDSVPFSGLQLASDDRMLPDSMLGFAPEIRGTADTHARVEVRQGNVLVYTTNVAPGPFVINDLYNTGYAGDLEVSVIEADGRSQRFSVPYASVAQSLRPGVSRFSLSAGRYRDESLRDTPNFVQATYQRGLSNPVTAYGGAIVADGYLASLGGLAFSTAFGSVALDTTYTRASGLPNGSGPATRDGQSYRLTYSNTLESTETNFSIAAYQFATRDYLSLADYAQWRGSDTADLQQERSRYQANISQPLPDGWGSVFLSGFASDYWDSEQGSTLSYQAGYNQRYRWGSLSLSASRTRDEGGAMENRYLLSLSIPLGKGRHSPTLNSSVNLAGGQERTVQSSLTGTAGEQDQFNFSLFGSSSDSQGTTSRNGGLSGQYNAPRVVLGAGLSQGDGYRQANLSARGTLIVHSGGVLASQDQGETMAIVHADGAAGATISNSNGVKLDERGYAVVANLTPYRSSDIELDPEGISDDVELTGTTSRAVPRYGAILRLDYPTVKGRPVLMRLDRDSGLPVPLGAQVLDDQGKALGITGQGSRLFIRGIPSQGRLVVRWGSTPKDSCVVQYQLPESQGDRLVQHLNARCEASPEPAPLPTTPTSPR